jgi:hypothetical protein
MRTASDWNERYGTADLPWDTGRHDLNLEQILKTFAIRPVPRLSSVAELAPMPSGWPVWGSA